MYNNVEKFVLAAVILCIGSLFFLMDNQSEEVELADVTTSESLSNEATVDVEITSLVNNANMGNSVNDEAMTTDAVATLNTNVDVDQVETTPVPSFNDAFLAARAALGPNQTFEWNGNLYTTNYAHEAFNALQTEIVLEEVEVEKTEPQLSEVDDNEAIAYNTK
tara:strand:- start:19 stop:510 length:492 start_codon:yes stop_codon:yes gene_type:complete